MSIRFTIILVLARSLASTPVQSLSAPEQALDVGQLQFNIGRAAVDTLSRMRNPLHLAEERVHLLRAEAPPGPDRTVAGHRSRDAVELRAEEGGGVDVRKLAGKVSDEPPDVEPLQHRLDLANGH